ncbi:DUF1833 family protein [Megalodesulfovibrio paquesii]
MRYATMSEAIQEAYATAPAQVTYFDTLMLAHPALDEPIQVVHSDLPLQTPQGLYHPLRFGLKLPEVEGKVCGEMAITCGPAPAEIYDALDAIARQGDSATLRYRQYLGHHTEPDMDIPVPLELTTVTHTAASTEIRAQYPNLTDMEFPRRKKTATNCQGAL